jgi:hypothetical protein
MAAAAYCHAMDLPTTICFHGVGTMFQSRSGRILLALSIALLALASDPRAASGSITMNLDTEFSGGADPQGATPWLVAVFENQGAGVVRLTMNASGLVGTEFVSEWSFNLDPMLDPTLLAFSAIDISDVPGFSTATDIDTGVDAVQADGDGSFDILFNFPTSGAGGGVSRFTAGESVVVDITYTGMGTLTEASFNFSSAPGGGNGTFHSAAHVQSISVSPGSGWVGNSDVPIVDTGTGEVPEAGSLFVWALLVSSVVLGAPRRRQDILG